LPSAQFTRIVSGGHSLYAALKSGSYRVFNCGFLDLSPGAGEWGRGRLTVSPRNQRGGSFLWGVLFVYFRAFDLRTCLRRTVRRKKQGRAAALRERLHSLWAEKVPESFLPLSINVNK
jgi:hypothetical protein